MTLIEFLVSTCVLASVVLQCVVLRELHDLRLTILMRLTVRRKWQRTWGPDDAN